MNSLIIRVLKYALFLGAIGELTEATISMRGKAFRATQHEIISLKTLNQGLMGKP